MITIEFILLIISYTALIIALFLEIICYKRNMESLEMIAFTMSLLFLIVSISTSTLIGNADNSPTSSIFTLLSMVVVSATTFFNVIQERQYSISQALRKALLVSAGLLFIATLITYFTEYLIYSQYAIITFLIASVVVSMIISLTTKPQKKFQHLEKSDRIFAIAFITLVPIYLILHFGFAEQYNKLQIGFLLPLAFILLAVNKIYDDLQRLSLVKNGVEPQRQIFINYGLTEREEEIAILLSKGMTYQSISEQLYISLPTVKTHAGNIYKKCSVKSRHELTALISS